MPDKTMEGERAAAAKERQNLRAVIWFVVCAYAIIWPFFYITLSYHCPSLEEITQETTLSLLSPRVLISLPFNWVPGICALLITRFVLHEDWRTTTLNRLGRKHYYAWAWVFCPAMSLIIVWLSVMLGRASFDSSMTMAQVAGYQFASGADFRGPFLLQLLPAVIILPALWAPICVGEEIGWRGFLLPKLMKAGLGQWKALILTGAIWGFWHAPVPLSRCWGHSYLGVVMWVLSCTFLGVVFGWLRLASGSVWVPAVAHAASNTISRRVVFLLAPGFNGYRVGYDGSLLGWTVYAVFIGWLARTGRLPVRPAEMPEVVGPVSQPEYAK